MQNNGRREIVQIFILNQSKAHKAYNCLHFLNGYNKLHRYISYLYYYS